MGRPRGNFEHGTVQRYRQGDCDGNGNRCDACKHAMSDESKGIRAGLSKDQRRQPNNVTSIEGRTRSNYKPRQSNSQPNDSNPQPAWGDVERSIHEHYEQYRAEHGPRVELLLCGARIMDDPLKAGIHATTMRQMEMIIKEITAKKKRKSGGRLATVTAMAGRRSG